MTPKQALISLDSLGIYSSTPSLFLKEESFHLDGKSMPNHRPKFGGTATGAIGPARITQLISQEFSGVTMVNLLRQSISENILV